jgi:hypothetical protein
MLEELNIYDWREAFEFGSPQGAVPNKEYNLASFNNEDVALIAGMDEGCNDEQSWMIYGQLKDGRWFYLEAWCDYTGWDCRSGGHSVVADTKEECEQFALTNEARNRIIKND